MRRPAGRRNQSAAKCPGKRVDDRPFDTAEHSRAIRCRSLAIVNFEVGSQTARSRTPRYPPPPFPGPPPGKDSRLAQTAFDGTKLGTRSACTVTCILPWTCSVSGSAKVALDGTFFEGEVSCHHVDQHSLRVIPIRPRARGGKTPGPTSGDHGRPDRAILAGPGEKPRAIPDINKGLTGDRLPSRSVRRFANVSLEFSLFTRVEFAGYDRIHY